MIKQKIARTIVREVKGAKKLQVIITADSAKISKEPADKPVKFVVLSTVLAIIHALPAKFIKNAESLSASISPKEFAISGTTKEYNFQLFSIKKDEETKTTEMVIPNDFYYFCKLFGIKGGTNGIFRIKFEIK